MAFERKVNILHIIENLACGGAERMLITTLSHMDRERFHNTVVYLYDDSYFLTEIRDLKIDVYPVRLKNIYQPLAALRGISSIIKKEKIDIVHTNLFGADIYGRIAGKLSNASVVSTLHNMAYESAASFRNGLFLKRRKILDGITGRLCNKAFIAVSDAVRRSAEASLGFKNVSLIYNSIDPDAFTPVTNEEKKYMRKTLGVAEDAIVIATAGRLDSQKGHAFLLEALSDPGVKKTGAVLLILGSGSLEGQLKDIVGSRGLRDRVVFLGYRKDIRGIVGCADMFVLPTISEGFGLSLLEAMALKVPCIASRTGGISEIIENGRSGLLVKAGCADSIARAILEFTGNPALRREMALGGYNKVMKDFDIRNNVKILERLYEDCLN
ncbi:MAG: glycosyltransferase [Candidatus Omnitrophica bacterium]|nr:glycosyltransferase [Candidatus Omnitrophota bacterium]MDD5435922.1 glycosyltransferase [Candidatus Omnitrophota bacterium]